MRLPSVERVVHGARRAARRFPLVILSAVVAAVAAMLAFESASEETWLRLLASASLGFPLFTAITLLAERRARGPASAWIGRAAGVVLLALFYGRWATWPEEAAALHYFHFSAGLHLSVAVIAYVGVREDNGFWQFNRFVLLRFLTGAVYSIVLFAGLAVALAGVDNLFGVDVPDQTYFRLWVTIAFVFNTWFFAAGVPDDFAALDELREVPVGLRAFAQYVLMPLVAIYLLILTSYAGRIVLTRSWPSGWIGYLVSALAGLGILSLLLVYPGRDRGETPWVDRYARGFWVAILPSIAMLLMAVWQRIAQYGLTERRYLLGVLAVWLAAVALYYAISRSRGIKLIPISLGVIAFLTLAGPWSAYSMSRASQIGRLERILKRHAILADGQVTPARTDVPEDDRREITGTLRYLVRFHGTGAIDDWFAAGVDGIDTLGEDSLPPGRSRSDRIASLLVRSMGLQPVGESVPEPEYRHYQARTRPASSPRAISDFEWELSDIDLAASEHVVGADSLRIEIGEEDRVLRLWRNGDLLFGASLDPVLERAARAMDPLDPANATVPAESLRLEISADGVVARIYFETLTRRAAQEGVQITKARGDIYLRFVRLSP